jgi:hypothetical protein
MDIKKVLFALSLNEYKDNNMKAQFLDQSVKFLLGDNKKAVEYFIIHYKANESFPSFQVYLDDFKLEYDFKNVEQIGADREGFLNSSWDTFVSFVRNAEINSLQNKLLSEIDLAEKKKILVQLQLKLSREGVTLDLAESADIKLAGQDNESIQEGIRLPINELNEHGVLQPGSGASLIAIPAGGKTSFAINTVFVNSFLDYKNSLYIYLEDVAINYIYRLKSRVSLYLGMNIPVRSLQFASKEEETQKKLIELDEKYTKEKKGKVYLIPFTDLGAEPMDFARRLSDLVVKYDIDFLVFDFIQRAELWKPKAYTRNEYLNLLGSSFFQVVLGAFNKKPCVGLMLSQTTKDGQARADKTKGKYHLGDAKEVAFIEQDSFEVYTTWMDDELKLSGQFKYQLLKSRYGSSNCNPMSSVCDLPFCSMGDLGMQTDFYNNETMQSVFNEEMEGL